MTLRSGWVFVFFTSKSKASLISAALRGHNHTTSVIPWVDLPCHCTLSDSTPLSVAVRLLLHQCRPSAQEIASAPLLFRELQAGDIVLGLLLGGYKPTRFSSDPPLPPVQRAVIFSLGADPGLEAAAQLAGRLARGVTFTRCFQCVAFHLSPGF